MFDLGKWGTGITDFFRRLSGDIANLPGGTVGAEEQIGGGYQPLGQDEILDMWNTANTQAQEDMQPFYDRVRGTGVDGDTGLYGQIDALPTYTEWLAQQGGVDEEGNPLGITEGDTSGLRALMDAISGRLSDTDTMTEEGQLYAAQMAGFTDFDEMQQFIEGVRRKGYGNFDENGNQIAGESAMDFAQGMSASDRALREKQTRRNTADMERRAERMVADSYSESGSMAKMFASADEALNQIADAQIKMQAQTNEDDLAMKMQDIQSSKDGWAQAYQLGSMTATQYQENVRAALGDALQGYSVSMDAIFKQNEQYLASYNADYQALTNQINMTFAAIQVDLGLTMAEYEVASQAFAQALQPYYSAAEFALIAESLQFNFDDVIALVTVAADVFGALKPGGI